MTIYNFKKGSVLVTGISINCMDRYFAEAYLRQLRTSLKCWGREILSQQSEIRTLVSTLRTNRGNLASKGRSLVSRQVVKSFREPRPSFTTFSAVVVKAPGEVNPLSAANVSEMLEVRLPNRQQFISTHKPHYTID